MKSPLVSVVITTYDRPHYLKIAIESVVNQTYPNIEVIVVDDGGPGDDNKILCETFSAVQYHKLPNSGGPARPRNFGLEIANGEFIAFLDDDDLWVKDKIEKQVDILLSKQDYILTHAYCEVIDENGTSTGEIVGRPRSKALKHGDVSRSMMGNWTLMMPTPLIRIEVARKLKGFNEEMPHAGEDTEFWVRCSFQGNFYYMDEPLAQYRKHLSQVSSDKSDYKYLPNYLYKALVEAKQQGSVDEAGFKVLKTNLIRMILKKLGGHPFYSIKLLFRIDNFWIFKYRHIKLLIRMMAGK